ncbi:MAG: hypothetical protein ACRCVT_12220 [Leadbetterella sp.]
MNSLDFTFLRIFLVTALISFEGNAQVQNLQTRKKLLDFGWNSPYTFNLRNNLKKYEIGVFDGVGIKIPKYAGGGNIFMVNNLRTISSDSMQLELDLAKSAPHSSILTDNFIVLYGGSQMDWFSDTDWSIAETHIRFAAKLAKSLHCKGILWDAEPYKPGKNPWKYGTQSKASEHTYEQYAQQLRKRGAQFIKALQEEFPDLIVYSLREFSDYQKGSPFSEKILPVTDLDFTNKRLEEMYWGLHLPFTVGILEGIKGKAILVDANEEAYYYTSSQQFFESTTILKSDAVALVPKDLQLKFSAHYKLGQAIAPHYISGDWANKIKFPYRLSGQGKMLTTDQQAQWLEHNAFYSLRTSDEYAWLYTEQYNWWTGKEVPAGFEDAILRAKKKVNENQELGFSVDDMLRLARIKAEEVQPEKKK